MTKFLVGALIVLLALTGLAYLWRPKPDYGDKTPLTWVSDSNPARAVQVAAFNEENPDLHLILDNANSGSQKILLQSSSGVGPDIFDVGGNTELQMYVEAGILWDVTDAARSMGFQSGVDSWPKTGHEMVYQGRQYAYPCNTAAEILIYNKNIFDFFGVPYPKPFMTWDEFYEMAAQVNFKTNPKPGAEHVMAIANLNFGTFFSSLHGYNFDEKGLPILNRSPELKLAFELARDVIFKRKLAPTAVELKALSGQGGWGSEYVHQFASGRFAMLSAGDWVLVGFSKAYQHQLRLLEEKGIKLEDIKNPLQRPLRIGAVVLPKFPDRPAGYPAGSRMAGINAASPRREEALKFLQFLAGPTYSRITNENLDALPGNPAYADLGVQPGPPDLAREELHRVSVEAMGFAGPGRQSPFILSSDVKRILDAQISRMESTPDIPIESLLNDAQREVEMLMRRNLDRNPDLRKEFISRFGEETYKNLP